MNRLAKIHPRTWKWGIFLSLAALCVTFVIGVTRAGNDITETCIAAGQTYDREYRAQNSEEASLWFPLHNKCNANYDVVPPWINPALVIFAILAVTCLILLIVALIQRAKARRAEVPYENF